MRYLVVFYSRTGFTKKVAETISNELKCDIEEIFDTKNRRGAKGYILACKDAISKKTTTMKETERNPSVYDVLIIGTPVWAFTMTPAIRTYIIENKRSFNRVAFFCTQGGAGAKKTFKDMQDLCGLKPLAVLELTTKEVVNGRYSQKLKKFIPQLLVKTSG
ncbi:MAG: hypothetical protein ISS45_08590 [Candidatus Omnitrophica bacterium]|nr:hypothetical protein [Candidatus Omnitrophota bacterium]